MDGSRTCISTEVTEDNLDALIQRHISSSPDAGDLSAPVASIVATANRGSLSVAETMRQFGLDSLSTPAITPTSAAATTILNADGTVLIDSDVDGCSEVGHPVTKVARLSTGTSLKTELDFDLNDIFRTASSAVDAEVGNLHIMSPSIQQRSQTTMLPRVGRSLSSTIQAVIPPAAATSSQLHQQPTNQITICLPEMDAGSVTPGRIQEIVQQMISSGKLQLKPESKIVVNVKTGNTSASAAPPVCATTVSGLILPQPNQQATMVQPQQVAPASVQLVGAANTPQVLQLQPKMSPSVQHQVISLSSNSLCQQQVLTLTSPSGSLTAGGLSNQDILKIVSQTGNQVINQPQLSQPVSVKLPEVKTVRPSGVVGNIASTQLTTATSLQQHTGVTGSVNQNTVFILPNQITGQQIKFISPRNVALAAAPAQSDSSGNVILVQMGDNKQIVSQASSVPATVTSVSGHVLEGLNTLLPSLKGDSEFPEESPWQQYVKQFNKLGPCPICGDKISGYHYGIFCCESCKGFFKRTVQNGKQYVCHLPNSYVSCDVTIATRKKCPACRFAKCVDKGMRIEAIRLDRTRGGRSMYPGARNRLFRTSGDMSGDSGDELPAHDSSNPGGGSGDLSGARAGFTILEGGGELTGALGGGDGSGSLKKKQTPPIISKIVADIVLVEQSVANEEDHLDFHESDDESSVYRALLKLSDQRLYRIVRWSRNLPEFSAVDTDDQILLLQNCWADILCLDCCWRSMPTPKEIRLTSHKCINLEAARELGADEVVSSIMQLTQDLVRLKLDQTEYACLKVILLMQPDLKNLKAAQRIRLYQEQVSQLLMEYTMSTYPFLANKFGELFLRIPELHRTSTMAREMLADKDLTPYLCQNSLLMELLRSDCKIPAGGLGGASNGAAGGGGTQSSSTLSMATHPSTG